MTTHSIPPATNTKELHTQKRRFAFLKLFELLCMRADCPNKPIIDISTIERAKALDDALDELFDSEHQRVYSHDPIAGTYYGVAAIVREVIRRYKDNDAIETTQQLLPGYERLQCSYALERNGSPCIIPINEFSAEELDAKADRLRANAEGLKLHAEEMDRYRESKFGPRESKNQQLTLIT